MSATLGGNTATYQYDAQGRRKARTAGGTTTIFVTDTDNREVLEYDGSTGAVLRWYAYGLGPNDMLGQINVAAGTRAMPIPDLLGSIVGSVDASTGAITKFGYLPYGTSAAAASPFGFTGQRFDQEAGLYYYRARHYSTAYGRFLQADPVGYDAGANLYVYVGNDPLNLIDPDGLRALDMVQAGLTVASFCPSICGSAFSLLDAGVSAARGDYVGAAISGGAAAAGIFTDAGVFKVAAIGAVGAAESLRATQAVAKYEVGTYEALKARSVVGDRLDIHHVVQSKPAQQTIPNYSRSTAPAIALTETEHRLVARLSGPYSGGARDLLALDIRNLRNVTDAPNEALQRLINLNKSQYPAAFAR